MRTCNAEHYYGSFWQPWFLEKLWEDGLMTVWILHGVNTRYIKEKKTQYSSFLRSLYFLKLSLDFTLWRQCSFTKDTLSETLSYFGQWKIWRNKLSTYYLLPRSCHKTHQNKNTLYSERGRPKLRWFVNVFIA
jgi:hypothetical protein